MSHRNWDYKKHFHVEFGAYVQSSQVNYPKNTNFTRTLDGIYLCPAPNLQGGNHVMDLRMGYFITRPKAVEITITDYFIKYVKNIAEEKGLK